MKCPFMGLSAKFLTNLPIYQSIDMPNYHIINQLIKTYTSIYRFTALSNDRLIKSLPNSTNSFSVY